jgi:hypothetical protein
MAKKAMNFYKLPVEIASSKVLTHSETLIACYLFTFFGNGKPFFGTNAYLSTKLDVQKSAISVCLKKLTQLGWITITNPKSNKRKIMMLNNPCTTLEFYKLYSIVAESKALTSLEKILISYILSFTDNGKRFYAKNEKLAEVLDISKEGFNTARIKFEEFEWIKVKWPKSPRRELIVINHPAENMPGIKATDLHAEVTELMELNGLENNEELPEITQVLPVNNDNNIRDKRSIERNIITEGIKESNSIDKSFSSTTNSFSFESSKVEETSSTKDASSEANASTINTNGGIKQSSTKDEAPASTKDDEEHPSTKKPFSPDSFNNIDEGATDRKLASEESNDNIGKTSTSPEEDLMLFDYEDEFGNVNGKPKKEYDYMFKPVAYLKELNMYEKFKQKLFIELAEQQGYEIPSEQSMITLIQIMTKDDIDELLPLMREE